MSFYSRSDWSDGSDGFTITIPSSRTIKTSPWKRKGLFYVSTQRGTFFTLVRKLDFISYHLILWIHGPKKLRQMAKR